MGNTKSYPGIYQILNIQNKKSYIGYSRSCLKRLQYHRNHLRGNKHKNPHLQSAWNSYGAENFIYRIVEHLDNSLTDKQFEEIETKWVIHFQSHLSKFGYNSVLPEFVPTKDEGVNTTKRKLVEYVCINFLSGERIFILGKQYVTDVISISSNKIEDLSAYWKQGGRRKSLHGWMIVKKEDYVPEFDYINYKKEKPSAYKYGGKYTATEYYRIRKALDPTYQQKRKNLKDVIPHKDRKLRRVPIIAHNIETGEERAFSMIKDCVPEFNQMKVYKCLNNEYGKYKHRGYYFKRLQ